MNHHSLSVREMQEQDIPLIADYWLHSTPAHMQAMGVDLARLPSRAQMSAHLLSQLHTPIVHRRSYCIIWLADGDPIGHCNTNPTTYADEGWMHLHLWHSNIRRTGIGTTLVRLTLPCFFENLQLKKLICEPYALNEAPNKTLLKTGFRLVKEYMTNPGSVSFHQPVRQWELTRYEFLNLQSESGLQ